MEGKLLLLIINIIINIKAILLAKIDLIFILIIIGIRLFFYYSQTNKFSNWKIDSGPVYEF